VVEILVHGMVLSGLYAMLALGFMLVFGVARIMNLAHTAFFMAAAYGVFFFQVRLGWGLGPALALTAAAVVAGGLLLLRLFVEPGRERESTVLMSTLAIAILVQEVVVRIFGGAFRTVPATFPGYAVLWGIRVGHQELATSALAVVALLAVWLLLWRTRLGLAIRASAQDRETAALMGVDVVGLGRVVVALGLVLAALAGAAVAPLYAVEPHKWTHPLVIVLAAVVLGGLGSLWGSVLGAVILAFAEVTVVFLVPGGAYLRTGVGLLVMLMVFAVRPQGLFGARLLEER